jgi:hypothetical protein
MKNIPLLVIGILFISLSAAAQQTDIAGIDEDTISNFSAYKRSISFAGLLQTRFVGSLTDNVDVNGQNFDQSSASKITNTFLLKRVRFVVKGTVNDHFSANLMFNFAEFSSNPTNKVLENAYVKYTLSRYFNLEAGQFRPFFGIEDALPVDFIRTLDYSNQYYAFGASGWQSFQIGVSVFGSVTKPDELPVRYYAGIYNGNNRNQPMDNDNEKNFYGRLEASLFKDLIVGINAAKGSLGAGSGDAWGFDVVGSTKLSADWRLSLSGEYKNGTNLALYNTYTTAVPSLSQVRMQGFYIFPVLRYDYNLPRVRAIEFSSRYEIFDDNYKINSNPRQTIIPNLTLIFADDFYAAIQLGVAFDVYKTNIPLTTYYNHNLAYIQLQVRF